MADYPALSGSSGPRLGEPLRKKRTQLCRRPQAFVAK